MVVGSYGDFVFGVSSAAIGGGQGVTFNSLTQATQSRLLTHTTVEGLPIVEFAGVDADRVTLTGSLNEQTCGDVDEKILQLRALQSQNAPRALTRGSRVFGMYLIENLSITEEQWAADGVLIAATYSLQLISTRPVNG